jgi:hypothetical protein
MTVDGQPEISKPRAAFHARWTNAGRLLWLKYRGTAADAQSWRDAARQILHFGRQEMQLLRPLRLFPPAPTVCPRSPHCGSLGYLEMVPTVYQQISRHRRGRQKGHKTMRLVIVAGLALTTSLLAIDKEPAKRLGEAASVFSEVMATRSRSYRQGFADEEAIETTICPLSAPAAALPSRVTWLAGGLLCYSSSWGIPPVRYCVQVSTG